MGARGTGIPKCVVDFRPFPSVQVVLTDKPGRVERILTDWEMALSNSLQACNSTHLLDQATSSRSKWSSVNGDGIFSETNVRLARFWLNACRRHHIPCGTRIRHPNDLKTRLPRRVIDVSNPLRPRLELRPSQHATYATLSYTWGDVDSGYKTTMQNLSQYCREIPRRKLPRTIREAISLAKLLGFQYLWVDALCIIQDSKDKQEEFDLMDDVYQNSELTIFALGSSSADGGLTIASDNRKPCKISVELPLFNDVVENTLYVTIPGNLSQYNPLFKRGWVLQEQVLSRRLLMFGEHYMAWECLCGASDERKPHFLCDAASSIRKQNLFGSPSWQGPLHDFLHFPGPVPTRQSLRRENHFDAWYETLKNYSRRQLTSPGDVLNALAGLKNAVKKKYDCTYCSGLWVEDMQIGLTWYPCMKAPSRPGADAPEISSLPSWSWASCWGYYLNFPDPENHAVQYRDEGVRVISIHESEPARLNVSGLLLSAEAFYSDSEDYSSEYKSLRGCWNGVVRRTGSDKVFGVIAYDSDPDLVRVKSITCLLCLVRRRDNDEFISLALIPTGRRENEYQRVGLIREICSGEERYQNDSNVFGLPFWTYYGRMRQQSSISIV